MTLPVAQDLLIVHITQCYHGGCPFTLTLFDATLEIAAQVVRRLQESNTPWP